MWLQATRRNLRSRSLQVKFLRKNLVLFSLSLSLSLSLYPFSVSLLIDSPAKETENCSDDREIVSIMEHIPNDEVATTSEKLLLVIVRVRIGWANGVALYGGLIGPFQWSPPGPFYPSFLQHRLD